MCAVCSVPSRTDSEKSSALQPRARSLTKTEGLAANIVPATNCGLPGTWAPYSPCTNSTAASMDLRVLNHGVSVLRIMTCRSATMPTPGCDSRAFVARHDSASRMKPRRYSRHALSAKSQWLKTSGRPSRFTSRFVWSFTRTEYPDRSTVFSALRKGQMSNPRFSQRTKRAPGKSLRTISGMPFVSST